MSDAEHFCIRCQKLTSHYRAHGRITAIELRCFVCGHPLDPTQERRGLFHHLWGLATKCTGYVKAEWQYFARLLRIDED